MLNARENALCVYNGKLPERIVNPLTDYNMLARFFLRERAQATPDRPFGGDGEDWFGARWVYEPLTGAPMVDPGAPPVLTDITKWREQVIFPELSALDFKSAAREDLNSKDYSPDRLNVISIMAGPFERLLCLMHTEDALCSLLEEPEECEEFFQAVISYKLKLIDRLAEVYPIDMIDFHDDWGTQRSSFMSPETWEDLLSEPMKRLTGHCKNKGIHLQIHSCGKIENLIPSMIAAGIEHWSSCQAVNDFDRLVHEFGKQITFQGCLDTAEVQAPDITLEEVYLLTARRIDRLCRGGRVIPFGTPDVKWLPEATERALAERTDFFMKEENRRLP